MILNEHRKADIKVFTYDITYPTFLLYTRNTQAIASSTSIRMKSKMENWKI